MKRATRLLLVATVALLVVGATAPTASASDVGADCHPCNPDCPHPCNPLDSMTDRIETTGDVNADCRTNEHRFCYE